MQMKMRRLLGGLLLAAGVLGGGVPAWAKVISLEVQSSPAIVDDMLEFPVVVTNHGDEPAFNVQVTVEGPGVQWSSPKREMLPVGEPHTVTIRQSVAALTPGVYPVVVRVFYTDMKRYPFSALSVAELARGQAESSADRVWALLADARLRQRGRLVLRMRNTAHAPQAVTVRLVLSQEFAAEPPVVTQTLPPGQEQQITFQIKNFSAREGSSYPIYALIESEQHGQHQTAMAQAVVTVVGGSSLSAFQPALLAVAVILLGIVVGVNVRKARPGRRRA